MQHGACLLRGRQLQQRQLLVQLGSRQAVETQREARQALLQVQVQLLLRPVQTLVCQQRQQRLRQERGMQQ